MSVRYSDLVQLKNSGGLEIDEKAMSATRAPGLLDAQVSTVRITDGIDAKAAKVLGSKIMKLSKADAGLGLWVPYLANRTVYGYLTGGVSWAASGPFSGCYFEIGTHNGQVYAAHISCESANDANVQAWPSVLPGRTVLFSAKMSMSRNVPAGTSQAAAIAFATVTGTTVEMTRVDISTLSFGGMTGPVFDVQLVANGSS